MRITLTVLLLQLGGSSFAQTPDSIRFNVFANKFITALQSTDVKNIQILSASNIYCSLCFKEYALNSTVTIDQFIEFAKKQSLLWKQMASTTPNFQVINFKEQKVYELLYTTTSKQEQQKGHESGQTILQFILIKEQIKFFGLTTVP